MTALANVIFPAFTAPYVSAVLFPVAAVAALAAELAVFRALNRQLSWIEILRLVITINVGSAVVGFAIAMALPSGLQPAVLGQGAHQFRSIRPGPSFGTYAILGYALAFVLSILIEWGLLRAGPRIVSARVTKPFMTVALANSASYAALIAISLIWAWFFW